jgi:hypothetical protein
MLASPQSLSERSSFLKCTSGPRSAKALAKAASPASPTWLCARFSS